MHPLSTHLAPTTHVPQELTEAKQTIGEMQERLQTRETELSAMRVDMQALSVTYGYAPAVV